MGLLDKTEIKEDSVKKDVQDDVQDIDLSAIRRKKFRIDGDDNRILALDTSDVNVITRLTKILPKLQKLQNSAADKIGKIEETEDEKVLTELSSALDDIDEKMRNLIDELFDSNVSEMCAPTGNMYSPYNGQFRFEHIIETLSNLYERELTREFQQVTKRLDKHTGKYTKK